MAGHKVGTQEEWQAERDELLKEEKELTRRNEPAPAPVGRDQSSGPERSAPSTRGWPSITGVSMSSKPSKPAWRAIASKPAGVKPQYTKSSRA